MAKQKTILFLCTGNCYRSRFAEILFASVAHKMGLPWVGGEPGTPSDWEAHFRSGSQAVTEERISMPGEVHLHSDGLPRTIGTTSWKPAKPHGLRFSAPYGSISPTSEANAR